MRRALLVIALLAVACNGGTTTDGNGAVDAPAVAVSNFRFDPAELTVAAGDTIVWQNADDTGHTATSGAPGSPDGTFNVSLAAGGEGSATVSEPGTYQYFCQIHPSMTATIEVGS